MTEVSLAWLLTKVTAPIVRTTKLRHVDGMLGAVDLELTDNELRYLSEPFNPHPIVGVLAQNTPEAANQKQVWTREVEK